MSQWPAGRAPTCFAILRLIVFSASAAFADAACRKQVLRVELNLAVLIYRMEIAITVIELAVLLPI